MVRVRENKRNYKTMMLINYDMSIPMDAPKDICYIQLFSYFFFLFLSADKPPTGFPVITQSPQTRVVEIGHTAVMQCRSTGIPTPKIFWLKDSVRLDMSNSRYSLIDGKCSSIPQHFDRDSIWHGMRQFSTSAPESRSHQHILCPLLVLRARKGEKKLANVQSKIYANRISCAIHVWTNNWFYGKTHERKVAKINEWNDSSPSFHSRNCVDRSLSLSLFLSRFVSSSSAPTQINKWELSTIPHSVCSTHKRPHSIALHWYRR